MNNINYKHIYTLCLLLILNDETYEKFAKANAKIRVQKSWRYRKKIIIIIIIIIILPFLRLYPMCVYVPKCLFVYAPRCGASRRRETDTTESQVQQAVFTSLRSDGRNILSPTTTDWPGDYGNGWISLCIRRRPVPTYNIFGFEMHSRACPPLQPNSPTTGEEKTTQNRNNNNRPGAEWG